jgi:hypothetical protein
VTLEKRKKKKKPRKRIEECKLVAMKLVKIQRME